MLIAIMMIGSLDYISYWEGLDLLWYTLRPIRLAVGLKPGLNRPEPHPWVLVGSGPLSKTHSVATPLMLYQVSNPHDIDYYNLMFLFLAPQTLHMCRD